MRLTFPTHGRLAVPDALGLRWDKVRDLGRHIAWRYAVDSSKLDPLDCERLAEVDYASFCGVVLCVGQPRIATVVDEILTAD